MLFGFDILDALLVQCGELGYLVYMVFLFVLYKVAFNSAGLIKSLTGKANSSSATRKANRVELKVLIENADDDAINQSNRELDLRIEQLKSELESLQCAQTDNARGCCVGITLHKV